MSKTEERMATVYQIENGIIKASIAEQGAELQSLVNKSTGQEYMWSGDPKVWGKFSPVLFPIVGTLKDNTYLFNGKAYQLNRHGFAREMMFSLVNKMDDELSFSLKSTEETLKVFPFEFELKLTYKVQNSSLSVTYDVINIGTDKMWFSVGGHPAFKLPMFEGDAYSEYSMVFEKEETSDKWPIADGGLIAKASVPFFNHTNILQMNKGLFAKDALILKDLKSKKLKLISKKSGKGFEFNWEGFPYLGIWAATGADFVCIEPWCGIADWEDSDQDLTSKEGIVSLEPAAIFQRTWSVTIIS